MRRLGVSERQRRLTKFAFLHQGTGCTAARMRRAIHDGDRTLTMSLMRAPQKVRLNLAMKVTSVPRKCEREPSLGLVSRFLSSPSLALSYSGFTSPVLWPVDRPEAWPSLFAV